MPLTKKQEQAAALVADDNLTDEHIARKLGIARLTLHEWKKKDPDFIARVDELREDFRQNLKHLTISDKAKRVSILNDTAKRLEEIRISRSLRAIEDLELYLKGQKRRTELVARRREIADLDDEERDQYADELTEIQAELSQIGGLVKPPDEALTGLVLSQQKALGRFGTVTEWSVDTATLKELRETLKSAAIEMGEWDEVPKATASEGRTRVLSQSAIVQVVVREPVEDGNSDNQ